jgi:hypothetical protein
MEKLAAGDITQTWLVWSSTLDGQIEYDVHEDVQGAYGGVLCYCRRRPHPAAGKHAGTVAPPVADLLVPSVSLNGESLDEQVCVRNAVNIYVTN